MRVIQTTLYKFTELSDEAKEKAINDNRYIDIEHFDWWGMAYEGFNQILKTLNGDTSDKFYFNIDRGSFCSFEWEIDSEQFADVMERETEILSNFADDRFKEMFAGWKSEFAKVNKWVKYVSENIGVLAYGSISHGNRGVSTSIEYDIVDGETHPSNTNLEEGFEAYAELLEQVCKDLSQYFLQSLRDEHEYRISDEAVTETLIANEYEFEVDGTFH